MTLRDKSLITLIKKDLKSAKKLEDKIFNDILEYVNKNQD